MTAPTATTTGIAVTGWGAVRARGLADVSGLSGQRRDPLPRPTAVALADFDVRAELGRKGTGSLDRATSLALVACERALADSRLPVDDSTREAIGVVLGTTAGSAQSQIDYSRETLLADKPYLVNPLLFPNTVMNCAAGQAAIRYGLHGPNTTVAGGAAAFCHALRYAIVMLRAGAADVLLVGAMEEFSTYTAWAAELTGDAPAGEGAAVFVLRNGLPGGDRADAEILAVTTGFAAGGRNGLADALTGATRRALDQAGVAGADVTAVGTTDPPPGGVESDVIAALLGQRAYHTAKRLPGQRELGDCGAALTALQFAALLDRHLGDVTRDGQLCLLTASTLDGGVAAAVLRGWSR